MNWVGFLFFFVLILSSFAQPNDYIKKEDLKQIENLILSKQDKTNGAFNNKNLKDTYQAVETLKKINTTIPSTDALCKFAKESLSSDKIENVFHSVSILETLGCGSKVSENVVTTITNALNGESLYDLVYAVGAVSLLQPKKHISLDSSEILPALSSILEFRDDEYGTWFLERSQEEGSPFLAGLALTALAQLVPYVEDQSDLTTALESVPSLMENADKSDESRLFFRHTDNSISSLKTTSFVIKGIADLAEATKEKNAIKDEHVSLIAAFLISQKYVSSIEDAHALVIGLQAVNRPSFKRPLVLSLLNSQIHASKDKDRSSDIKVTVTDVWGKYTVPTRVYLVRAYQSAKEDIALLSNQEVPLVDGEKNVHALDFLAARPDPGSYVLEFRLIPQEKTEEYTSITTSHSRRIQVVAAVGLSEGSISITDTATKDSTPKLINFEQGKSLTQLLSLKSHQTLNLSFKLKNTVSGRSVVAHQTLVQLTHDVHKTTAYFVVPHGSNLAYQLNLSGAKLATKLNSESGTYSLSLLVGDSFIHESFHWVVTKVNITFDGKPVPKEVSSNPYAIRPPIQHQFRPPATRAKEWITNIFTVLVVIPIFILLVGFIRAGANFQNFPASYLVKIYALFFVAGVGTLLGLIVLYWFQLKLFTALTYGVAVGVPTIFFGNNVLFYYAHQREAIGKKEKIN